MTYVALLRGSDVGGNRRVPMPDLKTSFEHLGFPVDVMLRGADEWASLTSRNPYPAQAADGTKVHIAFLHDAPILFTLDVLRARSNGEETWECLGRKLYLYTPRGIGRSRLSLAPWINPPPSATGAPCGKSGKC